MAPRSQACRVLSRTSNSPSDAQAEQQTTMLKRKTSSGALIQPSKRTCHDISLQTCPLAEIFREYGLLETILGGLGPDDLLALLLSSKAIHQALVPRSGSLENLLGRLHCSGRGVKIRKERHQKSPYFYAYDCKEYVQCSATSKGRCVETRPCAKCKVATCDECRIHCVYQSNFENPCDEDELPNFSGYVLLSALETPILSPRHLATDDATPRWQDPSTGLTKPYHDQGFIDAPFEDDAFGPPEDVVALLDIDLGRHVLAGSAFSNVIDPSPVIRSLHQATEQRKRRFCDTCLPPELTKCPEGGESNVCQCTLRSHILDRWFCLRCYETEEASFARAYLYHLERCACQQRVGNTVCMWCYGSVLDEQQDYQERVDAPNDPSTLGGLP
jgi:hypothetical protein